VSSNCDTEEGDAKATKSSALTLKSDEGEGKNTNKATVIIVIADRKRRPPL
jgi:hypothetical protein